jgi:hypothetical protein
MDACTDRASSEYVRFTRSGFRQRLSWRVGQRRSRRTSGTKSFGYVVILGAYLRVASS